MGNCVLLLIHDIYYSYRNIIIKMNKEDIYKHQDSHSTLPIYSNKNVERKNMDTNDKENMNNEFYK